MLERVFVVYEYDQTDDKDIIYAGTDEMTAYKLFNDKIVSKIEGHPRTVDRTLQVWYSNGGISELYNIVRL